MGNHSPASLSFTQYIVTLSAAASTTFITPNARRMGLRWMVTGTNPATVVPGTTAAVAGNGMSYNGTGGVGTQGGSDTFVGEVSRDAFSAISTGGTTICVWEGT